MRPEKGALDELVRQIVATVHPLRIILFGSAAREDAGTPGDLDVLVVVPNGTPRRETARRLYQQLRRIILPVDILVATPELLERHKENIGLIYRAVLAEGKEIYAAGAE